MQGQDSTSNAFLRAFYLHNEPNGINLRWTQNNEVPIDAFVHECHPVMVWMRQSSSSINNHNPVQLQDLLAEDGLPSNGMSNAMDQSISNDLLAESLSSPVAGAGIVQSLEERHSGSLITPFQLCVNMSPGNGQLTNRSVPLQRASSSIFPQSIDLNPTLTTPPFIRALEDEQLGLLFKPSGSFIDQNLFANDSSNSSCLVISFGIAKYIVEENDGGGGCSLDGKRLYYKRRAPEDEQLGARLVLALEIAPIMHQPSSVAASGLGAGVEPSDIHQTISVVGEAQHSQRNIHLRRALIHAFCIPFQWDAVTRSRFGLPFTPTYTLNGGDASLVEDNLRNTQRNGMLPSEFQRGNLKHMLRNLNFVPETNSPQNIAFNSRNSSTTHRITAIPKVVNLNEPQGPGSDYPPHMGDPIAIRQRDLLVRVDKTRPSNILLRSGLTIQAERQSGAHPEMPIKLDDKKGSIWSISTSLELREIEELEELMIEYRSGLGGVVIEAHMKRQKYEANAAGSLLEDENCCICQLRSENYADGEDLGKLDCGHYFHFDNFKQWRFRKNNCPICKRKAL
ncbi:hypothetical protein P3X46_018477 [Hevea brasiliensis]|uniref:RING-type E3 ubiquitin transferase n=1 Tax=Hevea brasiliensis TaxID=3981 RepID=A0ABQ9LU14_HEVBR|nr:hypothetical protein P3X46_018477 [Hevea brasiliensis]